MKWADWQTPPVICCVCDQRVTLKSGHRGFFNARTNEGRTWHLRCDPDSVSVVVEKRLAALLEPPNQEEEK
jgi:hypothetical protein